MHLLLQISHPTASPKGQLTKQRLASTEDPSGSGHHLTDRYHYGRHDGGFDDWHRLDPFSHFPAYPIFPSRVSSPLRIGPTVNTLK